MGGSHPSGTPGAPGVPGAPGAPGAPAPPPPGGFGQPHAQYPFGPMSGVPPKRGGTSTGLIIAVGSVVLLGMVAIIIGVLAILAV